MEKHTLGKFIAILRKAKGMTQKDLADYLFVSDKTVSRWERDESTPDINLLPVIAELFDVSVEELIIGKKRTNDVQVDNTKNTKQLRYLIHKKWNTYCAWSLLSLLLIFIGISNIYLLSNTIGAMPFIYIFINVYSILLLTCIFQNIIAGYANVILDDDECHNLMLRKHNTKVLKMKYLVAFVCLFIFTYSLPYNSELYFDFRYSVQGYFSTLVSEPIIGLFLCGILAILLYYVYNMYLLPKWLNDENLYIDDNKIRPFNKLFSKKVIVGAGIIIGILLLLYIYKFITVPAYLKHEDYLQTMFTNYFSIIAIIPYLGLGMIVMKNRK